ncbi:hypothetical protein U472_14645 [Orenia metallireducens]|uniref:Dolichyl-phosphate-mannose-protein mannosyltransferase n=1 Tax=Orenia metallireducens TaxID=1413210 RepID=A0A1C0A600_9FIRM|nr:hypothetical protein [Orenia metallireducens]OCL25567.1 hypothetical protein U472_14645 [Orenia metallireducens]
MILIIITAVILQIILILFSFKKENIKKYKFIAIISLLVNIILISFVHYYLHSNDYNIQYGIVQSQIKLDEITYHNNAIYLKNLNIGDYLNEMKLAFSPVYGNVWPFIISLIYRVFDENHMIVIFLKLFIYIGAMYAFANILEHFNFKYIVNILIFILFSFNPIYLYVNTSLLRDDLVLAMLLFSFYFLFIKKDYFKFILFFIFLILFRIPLALVFLITMFIYYSIYNKKYVISFMPLILLLFYFVTSMIPRWGPMGINIFKNLISGNIYSTKMEGGALAGANPIIVLLAGPVIAIIGGSPFYYSSHIVSNIFSKTLIYTNMFLSPLCFSFILHYIVNISRKINLKKDYLFLFILMFVTIYGYLFAYKGFVIRNFLIWGWILYLMVGYMINFYKKSNVLLLYSFVSGFGIIFAIFYFMVM